MAKVAGFLSTLTVQDSGLVARTITNSVTDITINQSVNQLDDSGLDKTFTERMNLRGDFSIAMNGIVDTAANGQHAVFLNAAIPSAVARQIVGTTVAGPVFTATVLFASYTVTPGADGSLKWSATGNCSSGTGLAWT